jgi:hypothetical protein
LASPGAIPLGWRSSLGEGALNQPCRAATPYLSCGSALDTDHTHNRLWTFAQRGNCYL